MSKINLEAPFQSFRGKICKHSKIIFAQRGQTQYTSQICNPRTKARPPSPTRTLHLQTQPSVRLMRPLSPVKTSTSPCVGT